MMVIATDINDCGVDFFKATNLDDIDRAWLFNKFRDIASDLVTLRYLVENMEQNAQNAD
jgi:hypothetical protein